MGSDMHKLRRMTMHRRALIVSTGRDRGALTAARALGRAGWTVGIGTPVGGGLPGASRYSTASHVVPKPLGDDSAFVAGVREAVGAGSYHIVFGGGDDWTAALATHRDRFDTRVAHPSAAAVRTALDKVALARRALAAGLAAPHTEEATGPALAAWRGPVVVKCRSHWSPGQTRAHRIEARWFPDAASGRRQVARIRQAGALPVLQRPIDGGLSALIGIFDGTRLHSRVQQVSSRLWPTPYGASARAVTVPLDGELVARAEELLRGLEWSGLVELQFLTDGNGVAHLTDLNGRFYGSMSLAEKARPGLVDTWARLELGATVPERPDGSPGVRYSWFSGDLRRALRERRGGVASDVAETLRWALHARHSVWDPRDSGPVRYLARERLRAAVRSSA